MRAGSFPLLERHRHVLFLSDGLSADSSRTWSHQVKMGSCALVAVQSNCLMRDHDFISRCFLALTAAGVALLCSSLLAVAFTL